MSLDFNLKRIEGWAERCYVTDEESGMQRVAVDTESMVFATQAVGLHEITRDNCVDFYKRLYMWEHVHGAFRFRGGDGIYFSFEDVFNHIGLSTNANNKARNVWMRDLMDAFAQVAEESIGSYRELLD